MLIEKTLWGDRDKVQIAIERLRQFEPAEGYYLAFSGGKDSITIYRLAEMAGVQFDAHYHVTTVDPPELVAFIKANYPQVARDRPVMTMFRLIKHKRWPPMRRQRYCCEWLKESGGDGRTVVQGTRWAESPKRRRQRQLAELCGRRDMRTINPIIDWLDADVWEFIQQEQLAYCSLYDEGFKRLGCVLCPLGGHPKREAARWPKIAQAYINTFDRVLELRRQEERPCKFTTGQELFDWWIKRHTKPAPQEARLFD
jgi:phosphoadenosine phosphosulfate reductase